MHRIFTFLCILLMLSACRKEVDQVSIIDTPFEPGIIEGYELPVTNVEASIHGFVLDENDLPIVGATVFLENMATFS
ncbi:MAG: carboxypeptidase-like regulatory domain-containing protein, partial [Bacteroidota bacterium]